MENIPKDQQVVVSRAHYTEHVARLTEACQWLGITQGRAVAYVTLVKGFFEKPLRTMEEIFSYNESCEVVDLWKLWRSHADDFPGLRQRLRQVCKKGPTLREAENPESSSNRPRNDAFRGCPARC
jgi:hypothetical protein